MRPGYFFTILVRYPGGPRDGPNSDTGFRFSKGCSEAQLLFGIFCGYPEIIQKSPGTAMAIQCS